jgi:NADH-quinone oxidoreductase subunit H
MNVQAVEGVFLLINLFFGVPDIGNAWLLALIFFLECLALIGMMSTASAIFARLRIDQLAGVGWKILVPVGLAQLGFIILMGV